MTYSAHLENEAERTRADLANSLRELRSRMTVGQLAEEGWYWARTNLGRDFANNFGRQISANPLPATLMGAAMLWMMFGGRSRPQVHAQRFMDEGLREGGISYRGERPAESVVGHKVKDMVHRAQSTVEEAASSIGHTATSAYEKASSGAGRLGETASHAYQSMAEGASRAARGTGERAREMANYAVEHPLVLAALGLAVGAAVAVLLPQSQAEHRLLGPTSDKIKRRAEHLATEQIDRASAVGERAIDRVAEEADRLADRGMHPGSETRH